MKKCIIMVFGLLLIMGIMESTVFCIERSGLVTFNVDLSAYQTGKEVRLWLPYPISDQCQLISNINIRGDYSEMGVYTDRVYSNSILYAQWPKNKKSRKLEFFFFVKRKEIRRRTIPRSEPCWTPSDYSMYLRGTSLGPVTGSVKELSNRITKGKKTVYQKAKAIYDWICENMYRDPKTIGCGKGDVCRLLVTRGGKCTDISSVFVALARAAGVPARELFGIRLGKKPVQKITKWQHCWAEFFLPGYGWFSVDPADVRKAMLVEHLTLQDPKTKQYRDLFWGGLDAYRFVVAHGRDIVLNPPQQGPPLNTFGYPYAEVGGVPLDFYKPESFSYRIMYVEK